MDWIGLLEGETKVCVDDIAERWGLNSFQAFSILYGSQDLYFHGKAVKWEFCIRNNPAEEPDISDLEPIHQWLPLYKTGGWGPLDKIIASKGEKTELQRLDFFAGRHYDKLTDSDSLRFHFPQGYTIGLSDLFMAQKDLLDFEKKKGIGPSGAVSHCQADKMESVVYDSSQMSNKMMKEATLLQILDTITPSLYPDGLSPHEKAAVTKSINTIKKQLPQSFEMCCKLVMEAMPTEERKEFTTYTRDEVIDRAAEVGVNEPMAREIFSSLPPALKK